MKDPFHEKFKARQRKVLDNLHHYRRGLNTSGIEIHTSLLKLVVQSLVTITNAQFITILGLDELNSIHMQVYDSIIRLVDQVAHDILQYTNSASLVDFPLTNLKEACYEIARTFKPIFFIPRYEVVRSRRRSTIPSSSGTDSTEEDVQYEIFKYVERYNQMWVLAAMIKQKVDDYAAGSNIRVLAETSSNLPYI